MISKTYTPPRITSGDFRTKVEFYEYEPVEGPEVGEEVKKTLFVSFAKIDEVWMRDLELAKHNGTLSDLTISIRDPYKVYVPTNKHLLKIYAAEYEGIVYRIKQVQPALQSRDFVKIIAEVST